MASKLKKPWSVTTTIRNPERLVGLLGVLSELDGEEWMLANQEKFQILLIQHREYGFGSSQFYHGGHPLPQKMIDVIDNPDMPITYDLAKEAFELKNYQDPAMRGRQSINPLKKLGFVAIKDGRIAITELGKKLIDKELDLGDAFLRCFIKWQIPNPASSDYSFENGYDVNPFIATLHLIHAVNEKEAARGQKTKGLSKREFAMTVPSLINYQQIEPYANMILNFRDVQKGLNKSGRKSARDKFRKRFAIDFLGTSDEKEVKKLLNNLQDYGDNAIRYFRLTRYFYIRGGGFYIDLEPRRSVEINALLEAYDGAAKTFDSVDEYVDYISDYNEPKLPWETREKRIEIAESIINENAEYSKQLHESAGIVKPLSGMSDDELEEYISYLRNRRTGLQGQLNHIQAQSVDELESYINGLEGIYEAEDRPMELEKLTTKGLYALNDALNIHPNYPVGDDNEPTCTAPRDVPDIECQYSDFNAICEVTMMTGRSQWVNEGQPVMRHLRDFEDRPKNKSNDSYCLFIAPSLHRDTLNTFWTAVKYEYEGRKQKIVPITIAQYIGILNTLLGLRKAGVKFSHEQLKALYDRIASIPFQIQSSDKWMPNTEKAIENWELPLINKALETKGEMHEN